MGAARVGEPQGQPHRHPQPNKNTHQPQADTVVVRIAETRRYDAGLGGSSDFLSCRIECVSKWVSLHSFEVGHVPDAMTRRADRALGRRSRATASRRLNPGLYRHV